MNYFDQLCEAMEMLSKHPRSLFLGQAVAAPGTAMSVTLNTVPAEKKLELPVFEETQLGMSIGIALSGGLPISIYPRWNFLLAATNQIVNHLDKLPIYSDGGYNPKVIIRTAVATNKPMNPQAQHLGDFSDAFRLMCHRVKIWDLMEPRDILYAYQAALDEPGSHILVERSELYA
jgi:pyruvate/2-oxoglutarate/acetoin dehydrogenase E1 component